MKITIQSGKGRYNPNYKTALVWFEDKDSHFFKGKCNWMPKHDEIVEILETLIKMEGVEKRKLLSVMFKDAIDRGMETELKYNH